GDSIRHPLVTGVQTCALLNLTFTSDGSITGYGFAVDTMADNDVTFQLNVAANPSQAGVALPATSRAIGDVALTAYTVPGYVFHEIGSASCRVRMDVSVAAVVS